ncbi:MAG: AAA family ATPase [Phycisphaeraceae bacterium]
MYQQFYNLDVLPFENTSDPRFFFSSEQHREAVAAIEYTIRMRKGIVLVTGDIGSGKTTVCRALSKQCKNTATVVQVLHGHVTGFELLRHIMCTLEVPIGKDDDHPCLLQRLCAHLTQQANQNRSVVLFVDEAQTLCDESLEELRLLTNFDTASQKLLQVVLIGQPELRERIRSHKFAALRQRIVLAKRLTPLNRRDTGDYIAHRIRVASIDPDSVHATFTPEAVQAVYDYTGGVPRLINVACDNCLLLGFVRETKQITPAIVKRVIDDMVPSFATDDWTAHPRPALSLAGNF